MIYKKIVEAMKSNGVRFAPALSESDLSKIEQIYGIRLPGALVELYSHGVPASSAYIVWNDFSEENINKTKSILESVRINGLLYSVERGFWLESWGERPCDEAERERKVRALVEAAPKVIPVWGHHLVPLIDGLEDPPVLSTAENNHIHYSVSVTDYFAYWYCRIEPEKPCFIHVPFWSDIIEAKSLSPDTIVRAHRFCFDNRTQLERSVICGCFHCKNIFSTSEITDWIDGGRTALCPHCGIDSVIGETTGTPMNVEFMRAMHDYWFTTPACGMVILEPRDMHFLGSGEQSAADLCLHGKICFVVGGKVIYDGDDDFCLSASAMRFLRSLYGGHKKGRDEQLFPCCGNLLVPADDGKTVSIIGCPNGVDLDILHRNGMVCIEGCEVSYKEYRHAVLEYARLIEEFYIQSPERVFADEYAKQGYDAFWREWNSLIKKS